MEKKWSEATMAVKRMPKFKYKVIQRVEMLEEVNVIISANSKEEADKIIQYVAQTAEDLTWPKFSAKNKIPDDVPMKNYGQYYVDYCELDESTNEVVTGDNKFRKVVDAYDKEIPL